MKVYGDRGSSNTRRVLTTAAYLGLEVEFVFLDLFSGENRTPEYLALNPNGTIPTLVDGDVVLFEASAIMITWRNGPARHCCPRAMPSTKRSNGCSGPPSIFVAGPRC